MNFPGERGKMYGKCTYLNIFHKKIPEMLVFIFRRHSLLVGIASTNGGLSVAMSNDVSLPQRLQE